jgi:hypothetical protein
VGNFVCKLCEERRTHSSWEDDSILIPNTGEEVHLGCLIEYSQELTTCAKLALTNLKVAWEAFEPKPVPEHVMDLNPFFSAPVQCIKTALTALEKGLHIVE